MAGASVLVAIADDAVVAAAFAGPSEAVAVEPGVAAAETCVGLTSHSMGSEEEGEAS